MIRAYIHNFIPAAQAAGITRLKFYADEKKSRSVSVYQGELETLERAELTQLFIEGEFEGFSGAVFVENFDPELMQNHIRNIQDAARYGKTPFVPYDLNELPQAQFDSWRPAELSSVLEQMCSAEQESYALDSRIDRSGECHLSESAHLYTLADEREVFASDFTSGGGFHISATARDGMDVQASHRGQGFAGGRLPDMKKLAQAASKEAVSCLGAGSYPTGSCPVVLESRVVCELLDAFMPAFFAQNVHNQMSVLAGKLGQTVAGENITIVEDPVLAGGLRCRSFDDEGVRTAGKTILANGLLQTYLHNRKTAQKDGCISGGNGFKLNVNEAVSTGYTNVVLQSGSGSLNDLIAEMGDGLLISGVSGVFAGAHPVSGDFSLIAKGYRVENGRVGRSVKQITIAGNFFSMLEQVQSIGMDELRMLMPHGSVCAPSLYIRSLMISGKEES